ncbi:MAG: hypothetical protein NC122_00190 [Faecalibacterium sp.]|nr:hypothetical protein [Ruminococcus sp.]MCM1391399.1 hypothetical protein [Ruminococcus sp.]MCM1484609.1 hypothetical protein [Faecalibacterium sp.]
MIETIERCFKDRKIVSFYFNKEDNCTHLTGFIYAYNENELLVAHITPRGEYDGFILNQMSNLYKIEYDGDYEKKILNLYCLKRQSHPCIEIRGDSILFSLLDFTKDNNHLISVDLNTDKITGFVKSYDDFITLNMVDDYGRNNGVAVVSIDEVITFSCDTSDEQDLSLLLNS